MKKDAIELKDFKEELSFLFETIYNELEEYELTPKELIFIFLGIHTIILRAAFCNYEKETLNSFIYGKFNFSSDIEKLIGEMNNMGDLAPDLNKYQLAYLFKYLGDNNHLGNITNKYLSKYKYPQWNFSETFGFEESINDISFFNRLFPDMITERLKNDSSSFGWTLRTYKDSKIISFYNTNLDFEKKESSEKTIIINKSIDWKLIILIIVLSSILFIGIGYIVGKTIYKKYKKKKRANELDDDYDYTSDKKILND